MAEESAKRVCPATGGPMVKLASGHMMPVVAFGTWKSQPGVTAECVKIAIRNGYRNIDCANDYNNEHEVGKALKELFDAGEVKREDLFIQAKLWNSNHRPEHVILDLKQTLEDLQITYLDSYIIHWPQAVPSHGKTASTRLDGAVPGHMSTNAMFPLDDEGYYCTDKESHYIETWHTMEDLVDQGLVKSIGISNFNKAQIEEVVKAVKKHPVSLLQNESHPYLAQKDLVDLCKWNNIAFQCFSPLGSGDTHLGVYKSPTGTIPLKDEVISEIATSLGKNTGQVILRWQLQRGVTFVSKSVTESRIVGNFDLFDWELSDEDMKKIDSRNCGWRHLLWFEASNHPDYPFKDELPYGYVLQKPDASVSSSGTKVE